MSSKPKPEEPQDFRSARLSRRAQQSAKSLEERREEERRWQIENAEAFASMNAWVEERRLPLAKFRQF